MSIQNWSRSYSANTFYSLLGFLVLAGANFFFNAFAGRVMGAADYGVYTSFFYLLLAFAQPNNSLQLAVARYAASHEKPLANVLQDVTPTLLIFSAAQFAVFLLLSPWIQQFYHLKTIVNVWIGAGVIVGWLLLAGYRGAYQGRMDFRSFGVNVGLEGVLRAAAGVILLLAGYKIQGAMGASIIGGFLSAIILVQGKRKLLLHHFKTVHWVINPDIAMAFLLGMVGLLPFGILTSLDLTLVQNLLGGHVSGYLSACGLFGKNLVVLSLLVSNVAYTYTLKNKDMAFWMGVLFSAAPFAAGIAGSLALGWWFVPLLFGPEFMPVVDMLPLYIAASLPLGVLQNVVTYSVARKLTGLKISFWVMLVLSAGLYYYLLSTFNITVFLITTAVWFLLWTAGYLLYIRRYQAKNFS